MALIWLQSLGTLRSASCDKAKCKSNVFQGSFRLEHAKVTKLLCNSIVNEDTASLISLVTEEAKSLGSHFLQHLKY